MDDSPRCANEPAVSQQQAQAGHNPRVNHNSPESRNALATGKQISCRAANPWGAVSLKIPPNGVEMCIRTCAWAYESDREEGVQGPTRDASVCDLQYALWRERGERVADWAQHTQNYSGFYPPDYDYNDVAYMRALIKMQVRGPRHRCREMMASALPCDDRVSAEGGGRRSPSRLGCGPTTPSTATSRSSPKAVRGAFLCPRCPAMRTLIEDFLLRSPSFLCR